VGTFWNLVWPQSTSLLKSMNDCKIQFDVKSQRFAIVALYYHIYNKRIVIYSLIMVFIVITHCRFDITGYIS